MARVREIRSWSPVTPLPHAPPGMLGVINLRGAVLPIIDLAPHVGYAAAKPTTRHAIMVVEVGVRTVGLLVDSVFDIFSVRNGDIQPAPDVAPDGSAKLVRGVIAMDGRMISLLSIDGLVEGDGRAAA